MQFYKILIMQTIKLIFITEIFWYPLLFIAMEDKNCHKLLNLFQAIYQIRLMNNNRVWKMQLKFAINKSYLNKNKIIKNRNNKAKFNKIIKYKTLIIKILVNMKKICKKYPHFKEK
jgi:hypothetical protein